MEIVSYGGLAIGVSVGSGGTEIVSSGGQANVGYVLSGGTLTVELGGTATGDTVSGGASVTVSGVTTNLVVSGLLSSGSSGVIVEAFGSVTVASGGEANSSLIESGGYQLVTTGGAFSGATINGGTLEIESGGLAISSTVDFAAGGTLVLNSDRFRGKIEGFGGDDQIDLRALVFSSGTMSASYVDSGGTSGTLTVTDGALTAKLLMIGAYVVEQFSLSTDGHGGTMINDPPVSSGSIATPQH
jgi:autotransporter passenger strand-loop-strand repeat protein